MLQCGGIWFAGGKFGITWKPYQMIVKPKHQLTPGVCHLSSIPVHEVVRDEAHLRIDVSEMIDSDEDIDKEYQKEYVEMIEPVLNSNPPEVPVKGRRKVVKS